MKSETKKLILLFFAGFFAKDIIDDVFFLMLNRYPIDVFGMTITSTSHKVMLVVSTFLMILFLYYGLRKSGHSNESK